MTGPHSLPGAWAVQRLLGINFATDPTQGSKKFEFREGLRGIVLDALLATQGELDLPSKHELLEAIAWEWRCANALKTLGLAAQARGVEILVFKGVALALAVYPRPGLRRFGDIDLCVQPNHLNTLHSVLFELGYQRFEDVSVYNCGGVFVDVHTHPLHQLAQYVSPQLDWWAGAEILSSRTGPVLRLRYELELALCLLHGAKHSFSKGTWLVDLAFLIRLVGQAGLENLSQDFDIHGHLYYAFTLLESCLGVPVPTRAWSMSKAPRHYVFLHTVFLNLMLQRRAPQFMGMLTPLMAIRPAQARFRYFFHTILPAEKSIPQRVLELWGMILELYRLTLLKNHEAPTKPSLETPPC